MEKDMKEKLYFFMGNEEFEYIVEKKETKFIGTTTFDSRLNCIGNSLEEVVDIVKNRISQLSSGK